jgi:hypothetical protein
MNGFKAAAAQPESSPVLALSCISDRVGDNLFPFISSAYYPVFRGFEMLHPPGNQKIHSEDVRIQ